MGYQIDVVKFPASTQHTLLMENADDQGQNRIGRNCPEAQLYKLFESRLGPDDDTIRLDGRGLSQKTTEPPGPLPRRIEAFLSGGGGADLMRGHAGVDRMLGGAGRDLLLSFEGQDVARSGGGGDVVKAAGGGSDLVRCGPGRDKAVVDRGDDVAGCERVVLR